jgi:hypothetical protein
MQNAYNSMKQRPSWQANSPSLNELYFWTLSIIVRILQKLFNSPSASDEMHAFYGTHSTPLDPILSQMDPIHICTSNFLDIHLNVTKMSLHFRFSDQNYGQIYRPYACYMPRLSHPWCDHPNNIWRRVKSMKLLIMQSPSELQIFSSTLCSPLRMTDQVSHPYKAADKVTALYTLIFMFIGRRRHNKGSELDALQDISSH